MKSKIIALTMAAFMTMGVLSGCGAPSKEKKYVQASENAVEATINSTVATDALGRSFGESNVAESEKDVGVFYFVWHGEHTSNIYDITKLNESNPDELWSTANSTISPLNVMYYWGEPLYGYYSSDDPWVIYRHIELFTMSGIDYICLDLTNISIYKENVEAIAKIILAFQEQGFQPPKITAMITGAADDNPPDEDRIAEFYNYFYKNSRYDSVWYRDKKDNKPIIIMNMDEDRAYPRLPDEIKTFFHFRDLIWPFEKPDLGVESMSWMDWVYPQRVYEGGYMSVSVAQHPTYAFSNSVNPYMKEVYYHMNKGRGYNYTTKKNNLQNVNAGTNLEAQWQVAFDNYETVNEIMVTGWNEWIATKGIGDGVNQYDQVTFVDLCNLEFSRDMEMMKGGYGDNFYLQNMRNVRKFKNVTETAFAGAKGTPKLNETWVKPRIYRDIVGDASIRKWPDATGKSMLENNTARNDISDVQVMNDKNYLYIKVITKEKIIFDYERQNNLNILLSVQGVGGNLWQGYNFIVNRTAAQSGLATTTLEKVAVDGEYKFDSVNGCASYLADNVFAVRIKLSDLGIKNHKEFTVDFKVADGISEPSDIINYYIDGDSAPIGRLNYRYNAGI